MDPRVKELSKLLTSYSCDLQKGEKVLKMCIRDRR